MSYLSWVAAALVATLPSMLASNLHAATACSQLKGMQPVMATPELAARASSPRLQGCWANCELARLDQSAPHFEDVTAPTHLPVVSSPDEVAAWHAEIFERLSDGQQQSGPTRYCKLGL